MLLLTAGIGAAQEDDADPAAEIASQLGEAERELQFAREHVEFLGHRIKRLRKVRATQQSLGQTEQSLEKAEDDGNDRLAEDLEDQLGELELSIERQWAVLELNDELWRVREIRTEMNRTDRLFGEAERLLRLQRERIALAEKLFDVYRDGPESEEGPLEEQSEELAIQFELRMEHLELSRELEWARQEENGEFVEELEGELRALTRELREFGEEEPEDEPDDEPEAPGSAAAAVSVSEAEIAAAGELNFDDDIIPLLRSACIECHNEKDTSGDLNLTRLVSRQPLVVNRSHWLNVIAQLRNRSMPPAGGPEIDEPDRRRLVAFLSDAIHNFDYATVRSPGFEAARRLTHEEYNNTVRDLFGIDLRPADSFPADLTASSGFDNSANSLFIQPVTMERYVGAAEDIIRRALPDERTTPEHDRAHERIFGPNGDRQTLAAGTSTIRQFATRAFRRPLAQDEMQPLESYFRQLVLSGVDFEAAVREVLQVILISPGFLIRTEDDRDTDEAWNVNDWELASRLSYFLWASMPDDKLLELAASGELRKPEVLDRQVTRLLEDDRSSTLGSSFASQWLGFNDLGRVRPGPIDNPWCTDTLIASMKDESALFFWSLVRDNAPIERLLTGDYTYLNAELAKHYGLKSVSGEQMRRVSLEGTPRGGILGHGSILAVTSFPGRTSPVLRGQWVLAELLGTPPPPPPPNVSEFDDELIDRNLSAKRKLELHRRNPNCYACHSQIDPLGFSLSEFDWFGRHRPRHRGREADTRARLPDGTQFGGLDGLRDVLVERRLDDLVTQITRKMLSYGLGRQLEYYDEATVREIVAAVQADDRRLQTLIREIVHSDTFQMKQRPKSREQTE